MEIDADKVLATGNDGSTPTRDFGDSLINKCFIPDLVLDDARLSHRRRRTGRARSPTQLCDLFDTKTFPGKRSPREAAEEEPRMGAALRRGAKDQLYDVLSTPEGVDRALKKLGTIKTDTIWWSAGAETQQLADKGSRDGLDL